MINEDPAKTKILTGSLLYKALKSLKLYKMD